MVRTMYRKVKNIKEFRSLLLQPLSPQELSIVRSCVKRVCGSQQVEESPSSSQHSTKSEPRKCRKWSDVSFPRGSLRAINITTKIPLHLDLLLPKITQMHYSAPHNFKKLEPFINAGLGLVFQKICLKYITVCT